MPAPSEAEGPGHPGRFAQQLHQLLTSRGIPNDSHVYPGRHDGPFVIRHFGEVIQFQWNAIGAQK